MQLRFEAQVALDAVELFISEDILDRFVLSELDLGRNFCAYGSCRVMSLRALIQLDHGIYPGGD